MGLKQGNAVKAKDVVKEITDIKMVLVNTSDALTSHSEMLRTIISLLQGEGGGAMLNQADCYGLSSLLQNWLDGQEQILASAIRKV